MKKVCLGFMTLALICCSVSKVAAQSELQMSLGYRADIPVGSFNQTIPQAAGRGFEAALWYALNSRFSLGIGINYNDYYQKFPRAVYSNGQGTSVSAVVSYSIQQLPLEFMGTYTLLSKGKILPYIGLGGGINFVTFDQYQGEFDNPQSAIKPVATMDAGVFVPLSSSKSTSLKFGVCYTYSPLQTAGIANLNTVGIHVGIRFPFN